MIRKIKCWRQSNNRLRCPTKQLLANREIASANQIQWAATFVRSMSLTIDINRLWNHLHLRDLQLLELNSYGRLYFDLSIYNNFQPLVIFLLFRRKQSSKFLPFFYFTIQFTFPRLHKLLTEMFQIPGSIINVSPSVVGLLIVVAIAVVVWTVLFGPSTSSKWPYDG